MSSSKDILDRLVFQGTLTRSGDTAYIEGLRDLMLQAADHIELLVCENNDLIYSAGLLNNVINSLTVELKTAWKSAELMEQLRDKDLISNRKYTENGR